MKPSLLFAPLLALASTAQAHLIVFEGTFEPESATVSGQLRTGTGSGTLRLEYDEHGHTLLIDAVWSGLTGNATNAHIHCCTAAALSGTAGIGLAQQPANRLPSFPLGETFGTYKQVIDLTDPNQYSATFVTLAGSVAAAETRLIENLGQQKAYLNIHTSYIGSGELRAFVTQVPEPQTYAMLLAGLAVTGWMAKRRRQA